MNVVTSLRSNRRTLPSHTVAKISFAAGLLLILFFAVTPALAAQTYQFGVPELRLQVYVQPDASALLVYDITLDNQGRPIDIVDVGLPHGGYDIANMRASIDGRALDDIRVSEYGAIQDLRNLFRCEFQRITFRPLTMVFAKILKIAILSHF